MQDFLLFALYCVFELEVQRERQLVGKACWKREVQLLQRKEGLRQRLKAGSNYLCSDKAEKSH